MANWFKLTKRPRIAGGEISAIEGAEHGSDSDRQPRHDAGRAKLSERVGNRRSEGRSSEQRRGCQHQTLAAEPIAQRTADAGAENAAEQKAAGRQLRLDLRPGELPLQKNDRPVDNRRVEPEEQTAERGDHSDAVGVEPAGRGGLRTGRRLANGHEGTCLSVESERAGSLRFRARRSPKNPPSGLDWRPTGTCRDFSKLSVQRPAANAQDRVIAWLADR